MVWKKVFPPQGGGSVRRWIRMRKDLFEYGINQSIQNQKAEVQAGVIPPSLPMKPLTMFDFRRPDDAADARAVDIGSKLQGWRISDDEVLGGYSRAKFNLMGLDDVDEGHKGDHGDHEDHHQHDNHKNEIEEESISSALMMKRPFVRWQGNIDTRISPKSRAKRSGFCAIRCPEFPFGGIPLGDKYNALEVQCRTDGRAYTVNLKVQSYFPDDLHQSMITVKMKEVEEMKALKRLRESQNESNKLLKEADDDDDDDDGFVSVVLPFQDFMLTSHGRPKAQQRTLDSLQLQHLGLTLMDGVDGPFKFDLKKIRLVNYSHRDGIIVNDHDDDEMDNDISSDEESGDFNYNNNR